MSAFKFETSVVESIDNGDDPVDTLDDIVPETDNEPNISLLDKLFDIK